MQRVHEPHGGAPGDVAQGHLDVPQRLRHRDAVCEDETRLRVHDDAGAPAADDVPVLVLAVDHQVQVKALDSPEKHRADGPGQSGPGAALPALPGPLRRRAAAGVRRLGRDRGKRIRRRLFALLRLHGCDAALVDVKAAPSPSARHAVQAPSAESGPMPLHLHVALAPPALFGILGDHPSDVEVLPVRDLPQHLLEGRQVVAGVPIDLQDHSISLHSLSEDKPCLRHVDTPKGDVVLLRGLVGHFVEDAQAELHEGVRDEAVEVLDLQGQLHVLASPAEQELQGLADGGVKDGVQEHKVRARPAVELQQDVPRLQGLGGRGARHASPHLQHSAGRCGLGEGAARGRVLLDD
mmetsp:Transcript_3620/g.11325  ORF Transcript_3620/g.11325 Transcript_3620/m.11325 type:complete len:351 (+) Transcript_3620:1434-2486(+)